MKIAVTLPNVRDEGTRIEIHEARSDRLLMTLRVIQSADGMFNVDMTSAIGSPRVAAWYKGGPVVQSTEFNYALHSLQLDSVTVFVDEKLFKGDESPMEGGGPNAK
jgi:hypothetical protein